MNSRLPRLAVHTTVLAAYGVVAIAFTWPLVLHLSTTLTGSPGGDTGNYVWNQWVFRHELLDHHSSPYFTSHLFGGMRPANLSLHNYTTFQNLVAIPLQPLLGVVATFNVVYLLMTVLTAYAMFLLARDVSRSTAAAWLAGLLFAWSPFMVTRGMGHFSLVAAAPLPLLVLVLRRATAREHVPAHWKDAVLIGALVWWSASTDVYYAVYAILIGGLYIAGKVVSLRRRQAPVGPIVRWTLDTLGGLLAVVILAIVLTGGWEFVLLGRTVGMRSLYTPVLAFTVVALARVLWHVRGSLTGINRDNVLALARVVAASGIIAAVLMTPVLYAFGQRFVAGDFNPPHIFWRSSPRGVDLLAFLLPNPNHLLTPGWIPAWLTASSGGDYLESVASIPWVALAVVGVGLWRGWRSSRSAALLAIAFTLLALGPFVYIAGVNTHVPGPWALLRYVPVMGLARTPARFVAVVMMMTAAMFAASLAWLVRHSRHRSILIALVGIALVAELVPLPRTLYSASIPAIYRHLAAAPETMRVLHMPFGIRDGRSSLGDFSAQTEFFQTAHQKPLMGGYLSRVSDRRRLDVIRHPILGALATLSERQPLADGSRQTLLSEGRRFVSESQIGFVVLDRSLVSDDVCSLMVEAFGLELIDRDGVFELYRPKGPAEAGHHDGS